ncbi:21769_t:CDS:2, partial [Racocetra persica]
SLWAIEARSLKLAFITPMTNTIYQELQKSLTKECDLLIELFPESFTNLPNLHVNVYLLQHAQNFATLTNVAVGVKEIVHSIFKRMVSHTNCKIIELELTWLYNTIQALRLIFDGWQNPRFNVNTNMLSSFVTDPYLNTMFSN